MKDFIEILEEESAKLGLVRPRIFRHKNMWGIITAFYHGRGLPPENDPEDPQGSLGAFAQMNYYRILVEKLKVLLRTLESSGHVPKGAGRIYCNSPYPEKTFALLSGLGVRGKNSLVIVKPFGTFLVLGGLLFSDTPEPPETSFGTPTYKGETFPLCGSCRACQEACPAGALEVPGVVDTSRCLQAYASHLSSVPEEILPKWGTLFYGCDICQEVCPHNRPLPIASEENSILRHVPSEKWGYLGRGIELGKVLESPDETLRKGIFRYSVLDMGWMHSHTLKRNALLALAHQPVSSTWISRQLSLLTEYVHSPDPILRAAAEYTMKKLAIKVRYF